MLLQTRPWGGEICSTCYNDMVLDPRLLRVPGYASKSHDDALAVVAAACSGCGQVVLYAANVDAYFGEPNPDQRAASAIRGFLRKGEG